MTKITIGPHCLENPDGLEHWAAARIRKYCFSFPRDPLTPGDVLICRAPNTDYLTPWSDDAWTRLKPARETAEDWMYNRILPVVASNPHVNQPGVTVYWELENEPDWKESEWTRAQALIAIAWYGSFHARALEIAGAAGIRLIVGNFSTGTPDHKLISSSELWMTYATGGNVFARLKENRGGLGFHQYDDVVAPLLRMRSKAATIRKFAGYRVPIFGTEIGVDGWRKRYHNARGYAVGYLIPALDNDLGGDYAIDGSVVFTIGGDWPSFKITREESKEIMETIETTTSDKRYRLNTSKARELNVRTAPGVEHTVLDRLNSSHRVKVIEAARSADGGNWVAIEQPEEYGTPFLGWVNRAYLVETF